VTSILVIVTNLCLTLVLEGLLVALITRDRRIVYYSLLCNLLTCPALNLLVLISLFFWGNAVYVPALVVLESAAVLIECGVYRYLTGYSWGKALGLSAAANVFSLAAGLVLHLLM
jgi:hypothetical protein